MGTDWPRSTVAKLVADGVLIVGDGYRAKNAELSDEGLPFARGRNLQHRFDFEGADRVPVALVATISDKCSRLGDVAFTSKGTVGRVGLVTDRVEPFVYSPQLCFWRSLQEQRLLPRFLYYWFSGRECTGQLATLKGQTDMADYVSLRDQLRMVISLPSMQEQRAIADVLGALDDKIESNRRIGARSEGLLQVVAERVLVQSQGSSETTLGDVLETLETGARPRGGVAGFTDGVPSIGAESIVRAGVFDFGKTKWIPREYYENMRKGRLKDRDVLLYKDGGKPGDFRPHVSMIGASFPFDEAAINEHVFRLRIGEPYSQEILYAWLKTDRMTDEMRRRATGVAIPGLNSAAVRSLPIVRPSPGLLEEVNRTLKPLMATVLTRARESRMLATIRDALLPKLVSGQIRVPLSNDPEEQVGAAIEALA